MSTRRSNRLQIEGNLGKDAELRKTEHGEVVNFTVAVNEHWVDQNRVKQGRTDWFQVSVWGAATRSAAALKKGTPVSVEGKVRTGEYTGDDGVKRPTWTVIADSFRKIDYGKSAVNTDTDDVEDESEIPPF